MKKAVLSTLSVTLLGTTAALAETQPYYFSDELKSAISECTTYSEDIFQKNPTMKEDNASKVKAFMDSIDTSDAKMLLSVQGKKDEKCQFSVKYENLFPTPMEYACDLSKQDQDKLVGVMNDKDNATDVEQKNNFITKIVFSLFPMTKVSKKFDVTLVDIINNSCHQVKRELSEEEKKEMARKATAFSKKFKTSLSKCEPDTDTLKAMGKNIQSVKIVGKKDGKCYLASSGFHIFLEDKDLTVSNFYDLNELISSDDSKYTYTPYYKYDGTLFALNDCAKHKKANDTGSYSGGKETFAVGKNIKIDRSVSSNYENGICKVLYTLVMEKSGTKNDYSVQCDIPKEKIDDYLAPNKELAEKYAPKPLDFSALFAPVPETVTTADKHLSRQFFNDNLCKRIKAEK